MIDPTLGLWLVTAHLLADFTFQPGWMARQKLKDSLIRSAHVYIHIVFTAAFLMWSYSGTVLFTILLWIALSHYAIDSRRWVEPREGWSHDGEMWVWLNDQILHLVSLSLVPAVIHITHHSL